MQFSVKCAADTKIARQAAESEYFQTKGYCVAIVPHTITRD
jgi:hypothetical protein